MPGDRVLRIQRLLAAPPDAVFAAWTDPNRLAGWWGPEGMSIPHHEMDVRQGGAWLTTMRAPDGNEVTVSGVYRIIDPPKRLVFTWAWHNDGERSDDETEVAVDFAPVEGGTRLTLVQQTFASVESRDNHHKGWDSTFNGLEKILKAA